MHFTNTALLAAAALLPATLASDVSCSGYQGVPSELAQCADYLTSIGSQACVTYGGLAVQFCQRGGAEVVGVGGGNVLAGVKISTPCINIAIAVGKILDRCTHDTGPPLGWRAGGQTDAEHNGNIRVHAVQKA